MLVLDLHVEDIEGAIEGDRAFVGAIGSGEGVEDVADAHHLGLEGDLVGEEAIGVAGTVEALVVGASDEGDAAEGGAPGDGAEEGAGVGDVAADLVDLGAGEGAARDAEAGEFVVG